MGWSQAGRVPDSRAATTATGTSRQRAKTSPSGLLTRRAAKAPTRAPTNMATAERPRRPSLPRCPRPGDCRKPPPAMVWSGRWWSGRGRPVCGLFRSACPLPGRAGRSARTGVGPTRGRASQATTVDTASSTASKAAVYASIGPRRGPRWATVRPLIMAPTKNAPEGGQRRGDGEALGAGQGEGQEHHVAGHVGHEHVAEDQVAEGVHQPGDHRQGHQERRQRSVSVPGAAAPPSARLRSQWTIIGRTSGSSLLDR